MVETLPLCCTSNNTVALDTVLYSLTMALSKLDDDSAKEFLFQLLHAEQAKPEFHAKILRMLSSVLMQSGDLPEPPRCCMS